MSWSANMEKQKSMEMGKQQKQQQQQPQEEESSHCNRSGLNNLPPLRCIVKLGGAAITYKHEIEKINEENLRTVSSQLRQAMMTESSPAKVSGMDWSKGLGNLEVPTADDFEKNPMLNAGNFVIVHGAGSFGHFQASRSGVHKGGLQLPFVKAGFVATRISVTSLNLEIVRALARGNGVADLIAPISRPWTPLLAEELLFYEENHCDEGIPSVGMSPFACGWSTWERNIAHADISQLSKTIDSGFVPVLHGDAVFDDLQGCTILSGDVIIRHLAQLLRPTYVVFLTDVLGVYDQPPQDSNAVLLREIAVGEDGSWSIVKPVLKTNEVEITVASHDTTGGMATKISEAAMIAKLGIDVYIVKAGTSHSLRALTGEMTRSIPDDWLGTVIRFSKQTNATG